MKYQVKKIENCFEDSWSYEYELPMDGEHFMSLLKDWEVRINQKLRRPVAVAEKDRVIIKCTLAGNAIRVSFPQTSWQTEKTKFEDFLEKLP